MITYLDLPKFSAEATDLIIRPGAYTSNNEGYQARVLISKTHLLEMKRVFKDITDQRIVVWYQRIDPRFNGYIHQDPREYAISYLLELGGDNVTTYLYDAENVVQEIILEPHRWHLIRTHQKHSVNNIEGNRMAISVSVGQNINPHLLPYCEQHWNSTESQ